MLCASSRLLQAVLRHRPKEVRRCAALLVGSLQSMLQAVAAWSQQEGRERSTVTACAALRRVYEEVRFDVQLLCEQRCSLEIKISLTVF
jgi:hypothetical protein